jgi:hypothetical protein
MSAGHARTAFSKVRASAGYALVAIQLLPGITFVVGLLNSAAWYLSRSGWVSAELTGACALTGMNAGQRLITSVRAAVSVKYVRVTIRLLPGIIFTNELLG